MKMGETTGLLIGVCMCVVQGKKKGRGYGRKSDRRASRLVPNTNQVVPQSLDDLCRLARLHSLGVVCNDDSLFRLDTDDTLLVLSLTVSIVAP